MSIFESYRLSLFGSDQSMETGSSASPAAVEYCSSDLFPRRRGADKRRMYFAARSRDPNAPSRRSEEVAKRTERVSSAADSCSSSPSDARQHSLHHAIAKDEVVVKRARHVQADNANQYICQHRVHVAHFTGPLHRAVGERRQRK